MGFVSSEVKSSRTLQLAVQHDAMPAWGPLAGLATRLLMNGAVEPVTTQGDKHVKTKPIPSQTSQVDPADLFGVAVGDIWKSMTHLDLR